LPEPIILIVSTHRINYEYNASAFIITFSAIQPNMQPATGCLWSLSQRLSWGTSIWRLLRWISERSVMQRQYAGWIFCMVIKS